MICGTFLTLSEDRSVLYLKHTCNPVGTGKCFCDSNDQVRQFYQFHQNLRHVVNNGDDLTLRQIAQIYLDGSAIDQGNDCAVYHNIGHRIHDSADFAHKGLTVRQGFRIITEALLFLLFLMKGTNHTHTGEILSGDAQYLIQIRLYLFIQRHGPHHDAKDYHCQQRNRHHKNHRTFDINGKCHNHGTKYDNGGSEEQSQYHINPGLYLIDVTGHPGDHGGGTGFVNIGKIQPLNMIKQSLTKLGRESHGCLRRKKLSRNGGNQTDHSQPQQTQSHLHDVSRILTSDPLVYDTCHNKRYHQFKKGLQQLKKGGQNRLFFVILQIFE